MSQLTLDLQALEEQWRRHGAAIAQRLRTGLPASQVTQRLTDAGVTPTVELIEWFGWHDGSDVERPPRDNMGVVSLSRLMSIDFAITVRQTLLDLAADQRADAQASGIDPATLPTLWDPAWMPLTDGDTFYVAINTEPTGQGRPASVLMAEYGSPDPPDVAPGPLEVVVAMWVSLLASGWYHYVDNGDVAGWTSGPLPPPVPPDLQPFA